MPTLLAFSPVLHPRPNASPGLAASSLSGLLYAALACLVLWPLPAQLSSSIALGTEEVSTVPFAMAWSFWWQSDRLAHGLAEFWQAPIFFPTPATFALSETNTLGGMLMAPLVLLSGSTALGYNLFLLLALTLNGFSASRLLMAWGASPGVGHLAGAAMLLLPLPLQEIGVLPLVSVFGVIWSLHAVWRWREKPSPGNAALVGLSLAATYLLCFQYALFLAIVLVSLGWLFLDRRHIRPRPLATVVLAAVLAGAAVGPVVFAQVNSVTEDAGFVRKRGKVDKLAAKPRHFIRTPWKQAVSPPGIAVAKKPGWKAYFPGTARVLLALLGLVWALSLPRAARIGWFLGGGALFAYAMALGPNLEVAGANVWELMAEFVPGYGKVRSVNRWAVFVQLFVVLLAGFGLQSIADRIAGRPPQGEDGGRVPARGAPRRAAQAAFVVLAALCVAEMLPAAQTLVPAPSLERNAGWGDWIRTNTPEEAVLAFLPFSDGGDVSEYESDAEKMMLSGVFRRRMVNGYSSFFPKPFRALKKSLKEFPDVESVNALRDIGVTHVVVQEEAHPEHLIMDYPAVAAAMQPVYRDPAVGLTVYELRPRP